MRFGTKAALLGAAISALTVSGAGSAYADDDQPAHTHEAHSGKDHSSHDEDLVLFAESDKVKFARFDEESGPAPIVAVPAGPLCAQSITATGGDADAGEGGTATGGAATASGNTQTLTCNITVNSPLGSGDQTVTRTSRVFFTEEDNKKLLIKN
ncbi:hypothetical protein [Streptomyces sp. ALI-76-A]|uniref:hypothetical protein n=1 Tax=Streptomyces sp. ALI-76-A TaxID=3025736 RepID=UPI00256ED67B|nr:hypothetical protein [Streptomyces sp. ALI-76-A]MDL5205341.1 hypothetical protein [Streptomyces sp. ALI-76-A]